MHAKPADRHTHGHGLCVMPPAVDIGHHAGPAAQRCFNRRFN
jgi:hypothetical protein